MDDPTPSGKLKFASVLACGDEILPAVGNWSLKTAELKDAADAFTANFDRVRSLILQVPYLVHTAALDQEIICLASAKTFGRPDVPLSEIETSDKQPTFVYHCIDIAKTKDRPGESYDDYGNRVLSDGMSRLNRFHDSHEGNLLHDGLSSILASAVILSWSSIEVLLGDLWEAAVNACPNPLALLTGHPDRLSCVAGDKDGKKPGQKPAKESSVTINLSAILNHEGGLQKLEKSLGTLLRSKEEVAFTSLGACRIAYSRSFSEKPHDGLDASLGSQSLDVLAAVRNVLVHKGGAPDDEYAKKSYLEDLPEAAQLAPLDGVTTCAVIQPAIVCGRELIHAVDRWINIKRTGRP